MNVVKNFTKSRDPDEIMLHCIWVFTGCQSSRLRVSSIQRVNDYVCVIQQLHINMLGLSYIVPANKIMFN